MKDLELMGKLADGTAVRIRKDATHYRAFNAEGEQVGQPFMHLDYLLQYVGITLAGGQELPPEAKPQPQKPVEKKVGEAEDKQGGKHEITYDGNHYRSHAMQGGIGVVAAGPYMKLEVLLGAINASAYVGMDNALDTPEGERQTVPVGEAKETPKDYAWGVDKCGHFDNGACKMDGKNCDGKCGEHVPPIEETAAGSPAAEVPEGVTVPPPPAEAVDPDAVVEVGDIPEKPQITRKRVK